MEIKIVVYANQLNFLNYIEKKIILHYKRKNTFMIRLKTILHNF